MKIERISENQIKCTLSRSDLASHQIKISELAYGSEKTRELFQDMMDQAFEEFGFDANDIPLMIEAIPVSMDCIVLMITRVEDPDEIDTGFTGLSSFDGLFGGSSFRQEEEHAPDGPDIHSLLPQYLERIFVFDDLENVIRLAHAAGKYFTGTSSLYIDRSVGTYYIVLSNNGSTAANFASVCNAAIEYGSKDQVVRASKTC